VEAVSKKPRVDSAAPFVDIQALIGGARRQQAMVRGIVPSEEKKVSVLAQKMKRCSVDTLVPGAFNIVLGQDVNGERVVLSGLQPREKIIVDGVQRVQPGAVVEPHLAGPKLAAN